ncbi:MAG: CehA/McbA family metallohydrolase, partial [Planctomycetota bacterium]
NDTTNDWKEASPKPEGKRLDVRFDSNPNAGEWTLFLEQRSIDNAWHLTLNDVEITLLKPFPELVTRSYAIPEGRVKQGANVLSFVPDQPNDDVVIGKLRLVEQSLREMFDTQPVELSVQEAQSGAFLPARVSFVDEAGHPVAIYYAETPNTAARDGVIYVSNQSARLELPPGKYTSYAVRGCEWSCSTLQITVKPGVPTTVLHTLTRELDTRGFIAADTHLHTLEFSGHGDASALERQVTLAGEGVELAVATDHNHNIDYAPLQKQLGLSAYYTPVVGNEVTTEVGHFNGFPLDPKDAVPGHESKDFVEIVDGIRARGARVVILNHPRWPNHEDSPFTNNQLDRDTGSFASGLKLTMDATEMINSTTEEADPMFVFADWFALLNRGVRIFAVGSSDSHTVGDPVGQGRTYLVSASDDPTKIDVAAACDAIKQGHTSISQGMFATVVVGGTARMGDTLTLGRGPARIQVELRVQAPSWIVPRKATLFLDGTAVAERVVPSIAGVATDAKLDLDLECSGSHDRWLVCVVSGDPARGPFWQSVNPYTLAATNPVFIDLDGLEGWRAPRETAAALLESAKDPAELAQAMGSLDEAVCVHLLDLRAQALREAGTPPAEIRKALVDLAARAAPAYEGVRRVAARL